MLDFFSFFVFSLLGIRDFISMEMKERDKIPDPMNREDTKKMKSNKFSIFYYTFSISGEHIFSSTYFYLFLFLYFYSY